MNTQTAVVMAVASSCLYFLGFVLFKNAGTAMPPLRGTRPVHFAVTVLSSGRWLAGGLVMGVGVALQFAVLPRLSLSVLIPSLLCGLVVLMFLAFFVSGERTSTNELCHLAVMTAGAMVVALAGPGTPPPVPNALLVLLAAPSFAVPILIFSLGDTRPEGQHARPLTGIAYGLSAGTLIGLAELTLGLQAAEGLTASALAGPLPWLFLLAVACGIAQLQIALQRCRMLIVLFVATLVAKTYLMLVSGLLCLGSTSDPFSAPWLLPPGLALMTAAFLLTPRYEPARPFAARRNDPGWPSP
ncbi:hypothetical protein [Actinocorallia populi]|uniref:hypothetical protein n=1 Tax=Actinocorallia populi TaxID=2079200 RepID=UPI000D08FCF3|nr:hypothetical protein [Actinocorallia populi]